MDKTPVTSVLKGSAKVIAVKGKEHIGGLVSEERAEHVTAAICFSASGIYMSLLIIFPRQNSNPNYFRGLPEGTSVEFRPSGKMQSDIFFRWLEESIVLKT